MKYRLLFKLSLCLVFCWTISSCSVSNRVSTHQLIQKRKFTKGWHIKLKSGIKASKPSRSKDCPEIKIENFTIRDMNPNSLGYSYHKNSNESSCSRKTIVQSEKDVQPINTNHQKYLSFELKKTQKKLAKSIFETLKTPIPASKTTVLQEKHESSKRKGKLRKTLLIIGWSLVLAGIIFALLSGGQWLGGVLIGLGGIAVGLIFLIIGAIQDKPGYSARETKNAENSIELVPLIFLFFVSLLVAVGLGYIIGILLWSETAMMVAIVALLILDIAFFTMTFIKRNSA